MKKILVVDDEKNIRENIMDILTIKGFSVQTAVNGKEAILKLATFKPDLIISDVMMPEVDGYELLQYVRHNPETVNIPFVFITAKSDRQDIRKGMELGSDDYITKPFSVTELLSTVTNKIQRYEYFANESNAKQAELAKQLTSGTTHELSSSIKSILSLSDLMIKRLTYFNYENNISMLTSIHSAAAKIESMHNNLVLYSELMLFHNDPNKTIINKEPTKIDSDLINGIVRESAEKSERSLNDVKVKIESVTIPVCSFHLLKIVQEVIDNAFKFSKAFSNITISGSSVKKGYEFKISDNGVGISSENIKKIGPFCQFDKHLYMQRGLGLGLFVAKSLTELYHGVFEIDSIYEKSTTVKIRFNDIK